jgi:hypothetical protein
MGQRSPWKSRTISASVSLGIIGLRPHRGGPRGVRGARRLPPRRNARPRRRAQNGSAAPQSEHRPISSIETSLPSFPPAMSGVGNDVVGDGASVTD